MRPEYMAAIDAIEGGSLEMRVTIAMKLAAGFAVAIAVVLIAHRPSIIATADKLIVLKDGIVDRIGEREEVIGKLGSAPARAQEGGPRLVAVS